MALPARTVGSIQCPFAAKADIYREKVPEKVPVTFFILIGNTNLSLGTQTVIA